MTINNGAITDVIKGTQSFDKVYHANDLVFERYLPTGTVLWQGPNGFISSYGDLQISGQYYLAAKDHNSQLLENQTLLLSKPITKLKTGLTINFDPKALVLWLRTSGNEWTSTDNTSFFVQGQNGIVTSTISVSDLKNRVGVKAAIGTYFDLYVQAVDDKHIKFYNYDTDGNQNYQNSTLISWGTQRGFLMIDSITAY